jgi:transcriptional regulator with GAF, ATPase, and Fis domain
VPLLANYFVERYAKMYHREGFTISPQVMDRLTHYRYPGNVRELENLIKRMIVLGDPFLTRIPLADSGIESSHTSTPTSTTSVEPSLKEISRRASQAAERKAIASMLEQTAGTGAGGQGSPDQLSRAAYKIKQSGLAVSGLRPLDVVRAP